MSDQFKCFIFDLDGTLLDTVEDLTRAFNYMRRSLNYPEISRERVEKMIGNGMRDVIEQSFAEMNKTPTVEEVDSALDTMRNYYLQHTVVTTKPYAGVIETLQFMREKGCKTAVVTNKYTNAAVDILQKFDMNKYFDCVFGNGEGFPLKPAPDLLWECAKRTDTAISDCVMVGDNYTDLGSARNAGCKSIFCRYGYGVELEEKPDFYIDKFQELKVFC